MLLGLDVGTSGCKASVFDGAGHAVAYAYREYGAVSAGPGQYELNPAVLWEAVRAVIAAAARQCPPGAVSAIGVSSFGESAVPVDGAGNPLENIILNTDSRGRDQCAALAERLGPRAIFRHTGARPHPMYTLCKLMWIRERQPELFGRIWKYMLVEDYVLFRLGGEPAIDHSLAARTMAFDVVRKSWSADVLDAAGVGAGLFSSAVPSGTAVGSVSTGLARELGLPAGVRLVTGGHDQVCAAVGAGALRPGDAVLGVGTMECVTPVFGEPLLNEFMYDNHYCCVPHALAGNYVTYAFSFTAGSLLRWFRDNFAAPERQRAAEKGISAYDLLEQSAADGPSGLLVLPHFAGAGTPHMDAEARGAILGLTLDTTPGALYKALMEGAAYELALNIERLQGAGVALDRIRAVGGGTRSHKWMQAKADITFKPIVTLDVEEAGTLGAAMLAGVATGEYASLAEAAALVREKREFLPDRGRRETYQAGYGRYRRLYAMMKDIYQAGEGEGD